MACTYPERWVRSSTAQGGGSNLGSEAAAPLDFRPIAAGYLAIEFAVAPLILAISSSIWMEWTMRSTK
jgi:hypothetical protein